MPVIVDYYMYILLYNALFSWRLNFAILSFENFTGFKLCEFVAATTLPDGLGNSDCWTALQTALILATLKVTFDDFYS
jgi:hypothetical protein